MGALATSEHFARPCYSEKTECFSPYEGTEGNRHESHPSVTTLLPGYNSVENKELEVDMRKLSLSNSETEGHIVVTIFII